MHIIDSGARDAVLPPDVQIVKIWVPEGDIRNRHSAHVDRQVAVAALDNHSVSISRETSDGQIGNVHVNHLVSGEPIHSVLEKQSGPGGAVLCRPPKAICIPTLDLLDPFVGR